MRVSSILVYMPMIIYATAIERSSSRTISTPAERSRSRLRSLSFSSPVTNPISRHDDAFDESPVTVADAVSRHANPADSVSTNQQPLGQSQPAHPPPPSQTHETPRQNEVPDRSARDVFDRPPNQTALGRHDDDPIDPNAGQRQQDTNFRHSDAPGERDVGGQFTLPPTENRTASEPPSATPSSSLSPAPSQYPTMLPSEPPSVTSVPSSAPSTTTRNFSVPSVAPSAMPSLAPSANCNADDAGFFGNAGLEGVVVTYKYEMEYRPTLNIKSVFDAIEKQASDTVLPRLFEALCNSNTTIDNTTTRMLVGGESRRRLAASGVSPRPDDEIDPNGLCSAPVSSSAFQCNVTDGAITIFLNDTENGESDIVLFAIRDAMRAGDFNNVHEAIERVSFVNDTRSEKTQPPGDVTPKTGPDNGLPVWAYVLIALGGLLFIGLGFFVWRRRQTREVVKDTDTRDDGYNNGMEELDESEVYQPPDTMSRLTTQQEEENFPVQNEEEYGDYEEETRKE